uniref:Retrotransposon gag domain-containing protein n=1 Tax=Ananas comosus var. bracteatus TaxID=296719 RepID=A0A6V7PM09_ANACO|nr:unnamed protein product [Ananas comosus var. bracteatus]
MPITRSQSVGADDAAHFEEVETSATSGSGEVRELRGQLAALTDLVSQQAEAARQQTEAARQQEARMKRLEDLLLQQAAASKETQAPPPPAPVVDVAPTAPSPAPSSSRTAPVAAPQEGVIAAPPVQAPPTGAVFPVMVEGAERDRLMEHLNEFRRCEERDRVWLATHHLDGEAYRRWLDLQENPSIDLAAISWKKFKELLLANYFPTSVKRKMEQDLRNLRQGDRTVAEYEREYSRLLHCVPFVVRDDEDKARIFEQGLRPSIFRFVQSSNLQTYREVVDRALIVESGAAEVQERREAMDKGKAKRPAAEGASPTHSRRPPKHPRSEQRGHDSAEQRGGSDRRRPSPVCDLRWSSFPTAVFAAGGQVLPVWPGGPRSGRVPERFVTSTVDCIGTGSTSR